MNIPSNGVIMGASQSVIGRDFSSIYWAELENTGPVAMALEELGWAGRSFEERKADLAVLLLKHLEVVAHAES